MQVEKRAAAASPIPFAAGEGPLEPRRAASYWRRIRLLNEPFQPLEVSNWQPIEEHERKQSCISIVQGYFALQDQYGTAVIRNQQLGLSLGHLQISPVILTPANGLPRRTNT